MAFAYLDDMEVRTDIPGMYQATAEGRYQRNPPTIIKTFNDKV